jgi:ribosomal-protein-alanine N-acetyltransferase
MTTVRPAVLDDLDAVLAIENESFSDPWSRHALALALTGLQTLFMVADAVVHLVESGREQTNPGGADADRIAGYFVLSPVGDEAELLNLAVSPRIRRRGIGAALVEQAMRAAAERGARAVFLEVRESNTAARALYQSAGFEQVGRRKRYYQRPREDALILRRAVAGVSDHI